MKNPNSRALWWLHPRFAVIFLGVPLLILAYLIPEDSYIALYETRKYVDLNFVLIGLAVYGGILAGSFFFVRSGTRPQTGDVLLYCRWVVWPLFAMTLFGYVAWFAYATVQAGGPGALLSMLLQVILDPQLSTADYVKFQLFETIPGITTFTQFGILYATVEALLWVNGEPRRRLLLRFLPLFAFILVRTVLITERLALVEFLVPVGVVLLSQVKWRALGRPLARFAPLYAVLGVFSLFAFSEYFRSWSFYRSRYDGSYLQFAAERFLGYYATALNNAAAYYYHSGVEPLKGTLASIFEFPAFGGFFEKLYQDFFDLNPIPHETLLEIYTNPELNNVAPLGNLLQDFSVYLAPLAAFVIGLVSASLYASFVRGRLIGVVLYPSWFIGLLEISRIYYWPLGRYFPVLAFLALSLLLFWLAKTPVSTPAPRRPAANGRVRA